MTTGSRIAIGAVIVFAVTAYMSYLGAASSWQYYLSVDECFAHASTLIGEPIRVSGRIAPGSLHIEMDRKSATFLLEGQQAAIRVACVGPLPDNLMAERQVVVEGRLQSTQSLQGDRVLTRCASKYASSGGVVSAPEPQQSGDPGGS